MGIVRASWGLSGAAVQGLHYGTNVLPVSKFSGALRWQPAVLASPKWAHEVPMQGSLLYSFSILSVFFLLNNKKIYNYYIYCISEAETFHSTCVSLLF